MKKIIKLPIESTTQIRKTEDSLCELYSHDKNNGLFEFEVTNVKLGNEKPYAMFKFMDSLSVWKVLGTIEDNKIKIAFDTSLITKDETVVCFLYLDDEERTTDFYRFKFKVKVSEIDKINTYAVKERYFNNSIIVDKVDVVTKDELKEALKGLTVSTVKGVLTETRADEIYAKKSEIPQAYDDTDLKRRVSDLENKSDNNTVYDDSDLRGRVEALESKPDNNTVYDDTSLTNRVKALEERTTGSNYDDSDLQGRVRALEERPTTTTAYDDTDVKRRLTNLEERPDNNTVYDDTNVKERLTALETKVDKDTIYDDSDLKRRVSELEQRPDNNTIYDDSALTQRVEALESKPEGATKEDVKGLTDRVVALENKSDKDTVYDDSGIKERLTVLENKPDNNTVYDDTALTNRVKALEDAPKINATDFATKNDLVAFNRELNNKVSSLDFEDFKKTIPAPYNDKALSDRVLALENKPSTGGGVQTQDTGWLKLSGDNPLHGNVVKIRRINDTVHVRIFNENNYGLVAPANDENDGVYTILEKSIQNGFKSDVSTAEPVVSAIGDIEGNPTHTEAVGVMIYKIQNGQLSIILYGRSLESMNLHVNEFSYITDEPFPVELQK